MSFFKRLEKIIKSNINYGKDIGIDIDEINSEYERVFNKKQTDENEEETVYDNIESRYYTVLEVEYGADFDKIKTAYKKLLKKYHPDLNRENQNILKKAQEKTKQLNEAYSYFEKKFGR